MEILTIVLSGLLSFISGGGIILDSVAIHRLRSQIISLDQQAIRVDNTPSYQIAQGKVQKVRIATRGLTIKPNLKIAALELETDPLAVDPAKLNLNSIDGLRNSLKQPLQAAGKLILTENHLNQALQSPEILAQLQQALNRLIVSKAGSTNIAYQLNELQIELQSANRLGVKINLSRPKSNYEEYSTPKTSNKSRRELAIALKFKIQILNGKTIAITEPQGTVNSRPMSSRLLNGFAEGISDRLNLTSLEANGILARILQLEINEDELKLIGFAKVETKAPQLSSKEIEVIP
ncbi:MAG: LmeA family phospholipid-binding protein [Waterburya sp.]